MTFTQIITKSERNDACIKWMHKRRRAIGMGVPGVVDEPSKYTGRISRKITIRAEWSWHSFNQLQMKVLLSESSYCIVTPVFN